MDESTEKEQEEMVGFTGEPDSPSEDEANEGEGMMEEGFLEKRAAEESPKEAEGDTPPPTPEPPPVSSRGTCRVFLKDKGIPYTCGPRQAEALIAKGRAIPMD